MIDPQVLIHKRHRTEYLLIVRASHQRLRQD